MPACRQVRSFCGHAAASGRKRAAEGGMRHARNYAAKPTAATRPAGRRPRRSRGFPCVNPTPACWHPEAAAAAVLASLQPLSGRLDAGPRPRRWRAAGSRSTRSRGSAHRGGDARRRPKLGSSPNIDEDERTKAIGLRQRKHSTLPVSDSCSTRRRAFDDARSRGVHGLIVAEGPATTPRRRRSAAGSAGCTAVPARSRDFGNADRVTA